MNLCYLLFILFYAFVTYFSDSEKPLTQDVVDPTGPAPRKGVLISFRTGKTMEIPEKDIVSKYNLTFDCNLKDLIFFHI